MRNSILAIVAALILTTMAPMLYAQNATLTVLSPNGGEVLYDGMTVTITWREVNIDDEVEVEYSEDGGNRWRGIDRVDPGVESVSWRVPGRITKNALVRVITKDEEVSDRSDAPFEIAEHPLEAALVPTPNGGEIWTEGEKHLITWQLPTDAVDALIELSTDNGVTWKELVTRPALPAQYEWTIPHLSDEQIATAMMRVSVAEAIDHFDLSDAPFVLKPKSVTVEPKPVITLVYPNGGERLAVDSLVRISWTSKDVPGRVSIEFSDNGGASWSGVTSIDAVDGAYWWKVPSHVTKAGTLRVVAHGGTAGDTADAFFEIIDDETPVDPNPGEIILTSPNGGEIWSEAERRDITWSAPEDIMSVVIELSLDGGTSWQELATVSAASRLYKWTIPHLSDFSTGSALVRIASASDRARVDRSDAYFSVIPLIAAGVREDATAGGTNFSSRPNPAVDRVQLQWRQRSGGAATISIYDMHGLLVWRVEAGWGDAGDRGIDLDLSGLMLGSYAVEIRAGGESMRERVVVVR